MTSRRSRTIKINIVGDAGQVQRVFRDLGVGSSKLLGNFGKLAGAAGIAGVGYAMVDLGRKAVGLAGDFEESMAKIVGLVGVSRDQVDAWGEDLKALAPEVGKGPQELADALFFVTSAGLKGEAALSALRASARASAAGLGETKDVAFAAAAAMNAYGEENLSAEAAVDILTNAVRQGNVEASDLAPVLGNVIPVAAELGVGFDQVGGALAAMTRLGTDAATSATSLRAILVTLLKPSAQAETELSKFGLSAAGLRTQLREEGLLEVLFTLRDAFGDNEEAITKVFPNVRALSGVLNLVGENADAARGIFDELANSTGIADQAFDAVSETSNFKMRQAFADLQTTLLDVGEDLLPLVVSGVEAIVPAIEAVLPFVEALIDILTVLGTVIGAVFSGFDVDVETVFTALERRLETGADRAEAMAEALRLLASSGNLNKDTLARLRAEYDLSDRELGAYLSSVVATNREFSKYTQNLLGVDTASEGYLGTLVELYEAQQREFAALIDSTDAYGESATVRDEYVDTVIASTEATEEDTEATGEASEEYRSLTQRLRDAKDARESLSDVLRAAADPAYDAARAVATMQRAQQDLDAVLNDSESTVQDVADAELDYALATLEAQVALDSLASSPQAVEDAISALQVATGKTRDEVIELLNTLGILDGTQVRAVLSVDAPFISYSQMRNDIGQTVLSPARTGTVRLARGGVARARPGGLSAEIAEAGVDEGVIPLEGQGAELVAEAIARHLGGSRSGSVTVIVELDGRQIARSVIGPMVEMIRVKTGTRL